MKMFYYREAIEQNKETKPEKEIKKEAQKSSQTEKDF